MSARTLGLVRDESAPSTVAVASLGGGRLFIAGCALTFVGSVAVTVYGSESMTGGMPMRGGWMMSMTWMRMHDQSWLAASSMFLGMWVAMMTAMMAPVLAMALLKFRRLYSDNVSPKLNALTAAVAAGYLAVWAVLGLALFPIGIAVTGFLMASPALARLVPAASTAILVTAGYLQLTEWKAKSLCRCRSALISRPIRVARIYDAWRTGIAMGKDCTSCCSALMAVLIVTGVMNLVSMALVATAITAERLHRDSRRVARVIGFGIIVFALLQADRVWQRW